LQECNPHLPTKDWKVVKVKEHEGYVNHAPIETARGVLNFGLSAIHIKVYRGDSNAAGSSAGNPAELVLVEELEAPGGPKDAYSTDSSLSREMRALGPDTEEAIVTVVEVAAVYVNKTFTNQSAPQ